MAIDIVQLLVAIACLVGLAGLCIHHDMTEEDRWPYPTNEDLDEEYGAHVGEQTLLFGDVRSVNENGMTVELSDTELTIRVRMSPAADGMPEEVSTGGFVQIYGELQPNQSMVASEVVVVNSNSIDEWYKLGASVVGSLVAVGYFLRHWRLSKTGWRDRTDG